MLESYKSQGENQIREAEHSVFARIGSAVLKGIGSAVIGVGVFYAGVYETHSEKLFSTADLVAAGTILGLMGLATLADSDKKVATENVHSANEQ